MKKIAAAFFLILAAVYLPAQTLSWDIKFLQGRARDSIPINQIIRMETGEVFQIIITPASDSYCYVVYNDSEREIHVLHNQALKAGADLVLGPFQLEEPPGTETLYVVMSLDRQTRLEELIKNHESNPGSRQHSDNLRREVGSLQNAASGLGEPASAFIASGGTSRSGSQEYATRFTDKNIYVRAITFRH